MELIHQTQKALQQFCYTFPSLKQRKNIRYPDLCDGLIFVEILKVAPVINISSEQLDDPQGKWILRLGNLKKIIARLYHYCESKLNKTLKSKDIDLIEISKNYSPEEIIKYFELIIAVLMQTPFKEDYIEKIMSLNQKSQSIFVNIIRNALDNRLSLSAQHEAIKYQDEIKALKQENQHLREEISFFSSTNKNLTKQVQELKEKNKQQSQQIDSMRYVQIQKSNENLTLQLTQQRNLTQNLKNKLINIARQHEIQISKYQQQINLFELKMQNLQQLQNNLTMYKQRYTEALKQSYRRQELQKQKRKFLKDLQEKQNTIKKMNQKIVEYQIKRESMQEYEQRMQMQLQKKQFKCKMLEKQVRSKLQQNTPSVIQQKQIQQQSSQMHVQEMQFLKIQIQKLRNSNRQLQRQNLKNKKKLQKINQLQKDKKKLQKTIIDVTKSRDSEIQMLVVSLWELRNENVKIFEILKETNQDFR